MCVFVRSWFGSLYTMYINKLALIFYFVVVVIVRYSIIQELADQSSL